MSQAVPWLTAGVLGLEGLGWIIDLPTGCLVMVMCATGQHWITNPFRRARPLLLPGMISTPLAELRSMPAQTQVHTHGRIRALEPMATYLGEVDDAVYHRVELVGAAPPFSGHADFRAHLPQMRDFLLVDEAGATVEIRMTQAEVKLPRRMFRTVDRQVAMALLDHFPVPRPPKLYWPTITEHWLADGDEVEVLGTVERVPDPTQAALPRELPTRPVLVSTHEQRLTVQLVRAR